MKKREHGYYWVKVQKHWRIMEWDVVEQEWYDGCVPFKDRELSEIDEERLEHEEG